MTPVDVSEALARGYDGSAIDTILVGGVGVTAILRRSCVSCILFWESEITEKTAPRLPRRTFLRRAGTRAGGMIVGIGAGGALVDGPAHAAADAQLPRRVLGRTKVPVGILSLGTGTVGLSPALRYALGLPGVAALNIGPHDAEKLRENVNWAKNFRKLSTEEDAMLAAAGRQLANQWGEHFGPVKDKSGKREKVTATVTFFSRLGTARYASLAYDQPQSRQKGFVNLATLANDLVYHLFSVLDRQLNSIPAELDPSRFPSILIGRRAAVPQLAVLQSLLQPSRQLYENPSCGFLVRKHELKPHVCDDRGIWNTCRNRHIILESNPRRLRWG